ncbi:MAG: hypothetical protein ABJN26_02745 [Stappiaceae bacterium]
MAEIKIETPVKAGGNRSGRTSLLEEQFLSEKDPGFARIYGFSFEGSYYHLPHAVLFLVHGPGEQVTGDDKGVPVDSRAPRKPEISGVGAADFDYSDDIRYWTYDREDISMRLDVETGRLEDILLEAFLGGDGDQGSASPRGAYARGAYARGAYARGAYARGAYARGNKD